MFEQCLSAVWRPFFAETHVERSTESYDNMGPVGVDKRWDAFRPFHDYLVQSFPLTYVDDLSLKLQ